MTTLTSAAQKLLSHMAAEETTVATIAMPLPARDFDPTEAAITWKVLAGMGHAIVFATPDGAPALADEIMLDGVGLDPWGRVPGLRRLRLFGLALRANAAARTAYAQMTAVPAFLHPRRWDELDADAIDGLVLVGGHRARGMRDYLESAALQSLVAAMFASNKPVGAICHGVLLAARSRDATGRSVLHGRKTTALTWAQEGAADRLARFGRWWDPTYYRTYLEAPGEAVGFMSVQQEVSRALASPNDFLDVPPGAPDHRRKVSGLHRDTVDDARPAFVVIDGRYVSARWPGDAHTFAATFGGLLAPG